MIPKINILFLLLVALSTQMMAQDFENQKITIEKLSVDDDATNFFSGEKGIECTFDVRFSEVIENFKTRSYELTWRLESLEGKVLYQSRNSSGFHDKSTSARAGKPFGEPNANYGLHDDVDLFILYKDLDLPEGKNKCKLVLSASHPVKGFPDFWSKEISFNFQKITIRTFEEQVFTVSNVQFDNAVGIGFQKMEIKFNIHLAYGPGEVNAKSYPLFWELLDKDAKSVFNSDQDFFTKNESINLSSLEEDSKNGGYKGEKRTGVQYKYLTISGEQELTFVLYVMNEGKKIKINETKKIAKLPVMNLLKDQEFTISNLSVKAGKYKGVAGVRMTFDCAFKYNSFIDEGSKDFYFYLELKSADGKTLYNPNADKYLSRKYKEYVTVNYMELSQAAKDKAHAVALFVPYFLLEANMGTHETVVSARVTNFRGDITYAPLADKKLTISKPKLLNATFEMLQLSLAEGKDYDPVWGNNVIKRLPDPQWSLKAGDFYLYSSAIAENSYDGAEEKASITFSEGDELSLLVIEKDKLFNPNDYLGSIVLPYNKALSVKDYKKGDISKMSYTLILNN